MFKKLLLSILLLLVAGQLMGQAPWPGPSAETPALEGLKVDAVFNHPSNGLTYFFAGTQCYAYDWQRKGPSPGFPKAINSHWPRVPSRINGALFYPQRTNNVYFFAGSQYYRFRFDYNRVETERDFPASIQYYWHGIPATVDATVMHPHDPNKVFLFAGSNYYAYDWKADRTLAGYPKSISTSWPGLPSSLTAAENHPYDLNLTYFYAGNKVYLYNWSAGSIEEGYPKTVYEEWKLGPADPQVNPGKPNRGGPGSSGTSLPLKVGQYHALLIGVTEYRSPSIENLNYPLADAQRLGKVLTSQYNFAPAHVKVLANPTRAQLLNTLSQYKAQLTAEDNLLVFFAGHGYYSEESAQGYWWPADAQRNTSVNWVSNGDIRDVVRAIPARHVLLVSDACFSGGLFVGRNLASELRDIEELVMRKSRRAITSGAKDEAVPDQSIFLRYFIQHLAENPALTLDSQTLFTKVRRSVIRESNTTPEDGFIRDTGDDGGDFVFIRKEG